MNMITYARLKQSSKQNAWHRDSIFVTGYVGTVVQTALEHPYSHKEVTMAAFLSRPHDSSTDPRYREDRTMEIHNRMRRFIENKLSDNITFIWQYWYTKK